jgi:hypothetical protein
MPAERMIGNYVLGALIGRGGMSEVHAAEHRFLGDRVAIKLLRSHLAADPEATTAFIAEATRTRAIDHPNVVRVIDFGSDGDDFYLVMERLAGESLASRLARVTRLDEAEVRRLGAAIADGVAAAHDRGIIHRDLKPGNIMLAEDPAGPPKIVDFGIARHVGRAAAAVTGSRSGTLAYMAPEQLASGLVAPCVDVWALGVILYEALAGRLPFDDFAGGRSPQLFETPHRLGELAAVSPALEALVRACLERDPGKRPPSMQVIARARREPASDQRFTEDLPPSIGRDASPGGRDASLAGRDAGLGERDATIGERDAGGAAIAGPPRRRRRIVVPVTALAVVLAIGLAWWWHDRGARAREASTPGDVALAPVQDTNPTMAPQGSPATGSAQPAPAAERPASQAGREAIAAGPASAATPAAASGGSASPPAAPRPIAATFTVEVRSAPAGATVTVDGKRVGVTPATLALEVPASILVTRAGYRPSRVRAERAGPIDVRLVPERRGGRRTRPAGETLD